MGLFYRALDAVDNAITDTVTRSKHRRDAEKFARTVRPGDTIYSVETHRGLFGKDEQLVHEHRVDRRGKIGHMTPAGLFLTAGKVSKSRPRGLQTVAEYEASQVAGPNAAAAVDKPKRGLFGGRKAA